MSSSGGSDQSQPLRRITRTQTAGNLGETAFDSEVVPSSLSEIAPILRVANEVEASNPRVAYLCKFLPLFAFLVMKLKMVMVFPCVLMPLFAVLFSFMFLAVSMS